MSCGRRPSLATCIFSGVTLLACLALWVCLRRLDGHQREDILWYLLKLYLTTPFLLLLVPSRAAPYGIAFVAFGMLIGFRYAGDIGPDSHFILGVFVSVAAFTGTMFGVLAALLRSMLLDLWRRKRKGGQHDVPGTF